MLRLEDTGVTGDRSWTTQYRSIELGQVGCSLLHNSGYIFVYLCKLRLLKLKTRIFSIDK